MKLLDTNTAAQWMGVSPATIRRWASKGLVQRRGTLGRSALYDVEELREVETRLRHAARRVVASPFVLPHTSCQ